MMNSRSIAVGVAVLAAAGAASSALAGGDFLLGTSAYTGVGFDPTGAPPTFQPYLLADVNSPGVQNLSGVTMDLADFALGTIYTLVGDSAYWSGVLSDALTTGFDMGFFVPGATGSNTSTTDTAVIAAIFSPAPGIGSPDFTPHTVTRVDVEGTSFSTLGPGEYQVTIEFSFYGVPTPGAATLLPIAGIAAARRRRA